MKTANVRKLVSAGIVLAGLSLGAGMGSVAQALPVARIGQAEVSLEQVQALLPELDAQQRTALGNNPALLKQAVQAALLQEMLVRAAQNAGWDEDPQAARAMQRARNAALAESYLNAIAAVPAGYPQEQEVRAVYEANIPQLMQPRQLELAQIFIAEPQGADKETQKSAERKRKAVSKALGRNPSQQTFTAAARELSDVQGSEASGGQIGWVAQEQILPALRDALQDAAAGTVVGPLRLDDGWHWLRLGAVREAGPVAFELVRAQLAERLRAERINANRQAYLNRLLGENPISINELALFELVRTGGAATGSNAPAAAGGSASGSASAAALGGISTAALLPNP